jgi:hypothetical protein|tara:strand:+ start:2409 stop:2849 length:441 start_codon:yes stop_codon:yes gene_type:complete
MSNGIKKVNRTLTCKVTGREIIVKPDKYKKLLEYYGTEEKVQKNFVSYTVEKETKTPTFEFWFSNCIEMKNFEHLITMILNNYRNSDRGTIQVAKLQDDSFNLCDATGINKYNIEFIQSSDDVGRYVSGITIKGIPFIGKYKIEIL